MSKFLVVFVALAVLGCASSQSNHFEMGSKNFNDRQLHYEIVQKSSTVASIVTKDITFPSFGTVNNVSYIKAFDQYTNGNGGYASILNGGIGQRGVTLHFKSQRGHGFNFILEIWGY